MKCSNASVYQYVLTSQDKFLSICDPLFKLGIKHFLYGKVFKNGKYLFILNKLDYYKSYLENINDNGQTFTQEVNKIKKNKTHFFAVNPDIKKFDKKNDPVMHLMYDFNIWNAFFIYKGNGMDFIETYAFYGERGDLLFNNFCLNNITILNRFCDYFNEKAADLIDCADESKLGCFEHQLNFYNTSQEDLLTQKIEHFLRETCIKKRFLKTPEKDILLSKREVECLEYLSLGKSAKEIAKILELSPRTIEFYIQKAKQKSGLKRSELLTQFIRDNSFYYIR